MPDAADDVERQVRARVHATAGHDGREPPRTARRATRRGSSGASTVAERERHCRMSRHVAESGRPLAHCDVDEQVARGGRALTRRFTPFAPQYAAWLAPSAATVRRASPGDGCRRAGDDDQRAHEAPDLHRRPDHRPQRCGEAVDRGERVAASSIGTSSRSASRRSSSRSAAPRRRRRPRPRRRSRRDRAATSPSAVTLARARRPAREVLRDGRRRPETNLRTWSIDRSGLARGRRALHAPGARR